MNSIGSTTTLRWETFNISHIQRMQVSDKTIPRRISSMVADKFALCYGRQVLLLVFFIHIAKGTVNVYLKPGAEIKTYKRLVMEALSQGLDDYRALNGLIRIQANTKNEAMFLSFMTRLGFAQETILEKYNNGVDYILWKKIYEG